MKNSISHQATIVAAMALTCFAGDPFAVPWYTIDGGDVDLRELAYFQNCFGQAPSNGVCLAVDLDGDAAVTLPDLGLLYALWNRR